MCRWTEMEMYGSYERKKKIPIAKQETHSGPKSLVMEEKH